jgi:hypothetical protein
MTVAGMFLALLAPSATASSTGDHQPARFSTVQPTDSYAGKTYSQWSAAWWQWAASSTPSPVADTTGADCAVNQDGPTWFLAGNTGGLTSRRCTIPSGKAILIPIIAGECSTVENPGQDLRLCAAGYMDAVTETGVSVDGTPVALGRPESGRFRFATAPFPLTFAPGNAFGVNPGRTTSVADGFWVLVKPLREGKHMIDFNGSAPALGFSLTVHYDLTVTRR